MFTVQGILQYSTACFNIVYRKISFLIVLMIDDGIH